MACTFYILKGSREKAIGNEETPSNKVPNDENVRMV